MRELIIGTRGSALALWQAQWVADRLAEKAPEVRVRLEIIKTAGDVANQAPLWEIGGSGLFVRELERALMDGRVDLAVHSMKDLPSEMGQGLVVAAVPPRWDPRDVLISRLGARLADLPEGARVGTSSARRRGQLLAYRQDLRIVPLRGNVDTRLRKAEGEDLDAIVLAAAGLVRLGREGRITEYLDPQLCLPAIGQGALAIQAREDDREIVELAARLEHPSTRASTLAERAFLRAIGGGCQIPVAALGQQEGLDLTLEALVASPDGTAVVRGKLIGSMDDPEDLGVRMLRQLAAMGASELLTS